MQLKTTILLGIVLSLTLVIGYKYYQLTNTIEDQLLVIKKLEDRRDDLKVKLAIEQGNVLDLTNKITSTNNELEKINQINLKLEQEFENWKQQPAKIKYVDKIVREIVTEKVYDNSTCEEGLELNKKISEIKYENL